MEAAGGAAGTPHRAAVGEHRHQDQRLPLGRVIGQAPRGPVPGGQRAGEDRVGRAGPVRVGGHPARPQALVHRPGHPPHVTGRLGVVSVPGQRAVHVGGRHRLPPCQAAEREPGERHRRRAGVPDGQLDQPPGQRVKHDRTNRGQVLGRHPGVVQRDDRRVQPGHRGGQLGRAVRQRDGAPQQERLAPLGGDQVAVVDHAQDLPGRRQHRDVVHVALEHVEQDVVAEPVGGHGVSGRGHDRGYRLVRAEVGGDHPSPQVTVGHDTERAGEGHQHRARALVGHPPGRLADRLVALAQQRRRPDQRGHPDLDLVRGCRRNRPGHDRPGDEPEHVRAGQQRPDDVRRDAVADRVLGGPGLEAGRQPGDHRRVAEQLARAEQVQDPPVVDDLDRAAAHHPRVLDRPGALREDRLSPRADLGLGRRGDAGQLTGVHRVERRMRPEEAGDVLHRGQAPAGSSPTAATVATGPAWCSASTAAGRPRSLAR